MRDSDIKNIKRRLDELEKKLAGNIIMEDRKEAARNGELEGRVYYSTPEGGVIKTTKLRIYCDWCGRRSESFDACINCGKQLCSECSVYFEGKTLCPECVESICPLSKDEFKALKAIASGVKDPAKVAAVTGIKKEQIGKCIKSLIGKEFVEREGFFPFFELKILDRGIELISAYEQVFRDHKDIAAFEEALERALNEEL